MPKINLNEAETKVDPEDPPSRQVGYAKLGDGLGAKTTGSSLYVLEPGKASCPYHWEAGEEEWLLVLEGRPTLREPSGETQLEPMDLCFFPPGPEGAHMFRNDTEETVRVLMYSNYVTPAATFYPDSNKVGVWSGFEGYKPMLRDSPELDYWEGEGDKD